MATRSVHPIGRYIDRLIVASSEVPSFARLDSRGRLSLREHG